MTFQPSAMTSRKSQKVYRSPSNADEPSPFSKTGIKRELEEEELDDFMDIDAEDAEAGNILMALKNHTIDINRDLKPSRSKTMSISNLLGAESNISTIPTHHISPHPSVSNDVKSYHENKRKNSIKKGFQICLTPRRIEDKSTQKSFRPAYTVRTPTKTAKKPSSHHPKNTTHIHICYRIYAHALSKARPPLVKAVNVTRYELIQYPSAFRQPTSSKHRPRDWHPTYHYQQDTV